MRAVWTRIHRWLDANAPKGYGHLRPGASAEAIRTAETEMGLKLPADVKASYLIHDGQSKEPGLIGGEGWCLLPLRDMMKAWRRWSRHDPKYASRVPVARGGAGDYIFVDLGAKDKNSNRLIVQRSDSDTPDPVAPSFRAWLEDFAEKLEDEELTYSEEHGEIMYADEIDLD